MRVLSQTWYEHQESSEFNVSKKERKKSFSRANSRYQWEIRLKEGDKPGKRRETKGTKYSTFSKNIKQSKVFHKDKNTYTVIVDVENAIEEIKGVIFARSGDSAKNLVEVELKLDSVKNVSSGEELKIVNDKKIIFENLTKGIHEFEFQTSKITSYLHYFYNKKQQRWQVMANYPHPVLGNTDDTIPLFKFLWKRARNPEGKEDLILENISYEINNKKLEELIEEENRCVLWNYMQGGI